MDPESKVDGWEMGHREWIGYSTKVQTDEQQSSCLTGGVKELGRENGMLDYG